MWQHFQDWLKKPISTEATAGDYFLFVGFILVCIVAWNLILVHIFEGLEA